MAERRNDDKDPASKSAQAAAEKSASASVLADETVPEGSAAHSIGASSAAHSIGASSAAHSIGASSAAHFIGASSAAHSIGASSAAHSIGASSGLSTFQSQGGSFGYIPASPPKSVSLEEMMEASNLIQNISLAHEIAVDEDFEMKSSEPAQGSLEKQVSETMRRAFWDLVEKRLSEQPPDYLCALELIQEIKEKLIHLLSERQVRAKRVIEEALDMELIRQQIENGAFEVENYTQFVIKIMSQFCAPARDDDVAKLSEIKEIVPLFRDIFKVLDIMGMDTANATISLMRPYIKEQSVVYERAKFAELAAKQEASGVDGLEYTREWLERSYETLEEKAEGHEFFFTNLRDMKTTPANVLHGAYLELINWTDDSTYPETCVMDQQRFMDISHNLRKLTLLSAALLVSFTQMGDRLRDHTQLRERLKTEIFAILSDVPASQYQLKMVNVAQHIAQEVNKELGILGYKQLDSDQLKEYESTISAAAIREHPVHSLLWKRVVTFVWQSLCHSGSSQPLQLPAGLGVVSGEITPYFGKLLRLVSHNRAVFGPVYADIISTLMNVTDLSPRLAR